MVFSSGKSDPFKIDRSVQHQIPSSQPIILIYTSRHIRIVRNLFVYYLIRIKIHVPLNLETFIFAPLFFVHSQILRPFNFRAPLSYCKFAVFSFICSIFSSPFNFSAYLLRKLAPFNFRAG